MPTAGALDVVRAFADRHGIAPRVQVPVGSPWDRAVAAQGWVLDVGHPAGALVSVRVADLTLVAAGADRPAVDAEAPVDDWWRLVLGGRPTPAQRHVLAGVAGWFPVLHEDGVPVAACRAVCVEDHLHVSVMTVAPGARRRGHGTALLRQAATWGRERGARWGVLQVAVHNTAALALYGSSGWTEHHRYRYLVPGGG
jgi:ribosomal protein S18 acetylase RimI-like enzyme